MTPNELANRIDSSWRQGKISFPERQALISKLQPALAERGRCRKCGGPLRPSTDVTPTPARPASPVAKSVTYNDTPKGRIEAEIAQKVERLVEQSGGKLSREEALLELVTKIDRTLYTRYRQASDDPRDRGSATA